jgi:hypothetical protein
VLLAKHTFCYVQILLDANCHDVLQIIILDPDCSLQCDILSRNILGQDARSRVLRASEPFSLHAVASIDGVDVLCPAAATARLDMLMMLMHH